MKLCFKVIFLCPGYNKMDLQSKHFSVLVPRFLPNMLAAPLLSPNHQTIFVFSSLSTIRSCFLYVVAYKCSRIHVTSEKHKTLQSLTLHFFPNSPLVQLYTSASDCKAVETLLEAILRNPFQLFRSILNDARSITKALSL